MADIMSSEMCPSCARAGQLTAMLAARLAGKLRRGDWRHSVVLGIPGAGLELARALSQELEAPFHSLYISPVLWPDNSGQIIGAVSGVTDVVYIDDRALADAGGTLPKAMSQIQIAKSQCLEEAVSRNGHFMLDEVKDAKVIVCACSHASDAVVIAGVETISLKRPKSLVLATPFLPEKLKLACSEMAEEFVYLREFAGSDEASSFAENLSSLDKAQVSSLLDSKKASA